jgi:hypothetical protein
VKRYLYELFTQPYVSMWLIYSVEFVYYKALLISPFHFLDFSSNYVLNSICSKDMALDLAWLLPLYKNPKIFSFYKTGFFISDLQKQICSLIRDFALVLEESWPNVWRMITKVTVGGVLKLP